MQSIKPYWNDLVVLNHRIINFELQIKKPTDIEIIDNLYEQGHNLDNLKLNSKLYKQLFYNYYIKNIVKKVSESQKKMFFIIPKPENNEFSNILGNERAEASYKTNITKLVKLLPIKYHIDLTKSYEDIILSKESEFKDWITAQITKQGSISSEKTYKQIKKLTDYYNLKYINNKIFKELQYKSVF